MTSISSTKAKAAMPPRRYQRFLTRKPLALRTASSAVIFSLTAAVLTAGCGSGGGGARLNGGGVPNSGSVGSSSSATEGRGRAAITIHWPARRTGTTRLIPEASNSIVVQMMRASDGNVLQSQIVPRPAGNAPSSDVTFDNLPIDTLNVVATAYPNADGSGVAQATGTGSLTTTADGSVASFGVTMGSTIDHVSVTAASPSLLIGKTLSLIATAYNAASESTASVVLVAPGQLTWSVASVPDGAATVDGTGLVTGQATGVATITVRDKESGKSASTTITVLTKPSVPDSVGPAQFNPNGDSYIDSLTTDSAGKIAYSGGWTTVSGHNYQFNTGTVDVTDPASALPPTLTDTTTGKIIAYGKLVTQTFSQDVKRITYAVFDFPGDISIGSGCQVTAASGYFSSTTSRETNTKPLVLLTQGSFTLSGSATLSVSSNGAYGGAGGWYSGQGPGAGKILTPTYPTPRYYGGASFGGLGGGATSGTYGDDFHDATKPHLQGGSGGVVNSIIGGDPAGGGGALYIGSVGQLTVNGGSLHAYGIGSGGGIALFGGGVQLTNATIEANATGGSGSNTQSAGSIRVFAGSGGGRIVIGYGAGNAPSTMGVTASGSGAPANYPTYNGVTLAGRDGTVDVIPFSGF